MPQALVRHELDNGLVVLAKEMHHAPVVAFSVWYRVGSRNEVPGITGVSHWVEHMMYKGSARFGKGEHDRQVNSRGGQHNGFCTEDFTAYYEVLPAEHLEVAVALEADRMGHAAFDPHELESERTVILSEREGAENRPTFWLSEAVTAACWTVHPYRQGVIGAKCDLGQMTRDDLWHHYRAYYSPDNAVLVAAGNFRVQDLIPLVETNFGPLRRGPARRPLRSVEPPQTGQRRVEVRRPGPTSYLEWAFHIPAAGHPDLPALMCLAAVLGGGSSPLPWRSLPMGRSSRLGRRLVEGGLAARAGAVAHLRADPSVLEVHAAARGGVPPARIEAEAWSCLEQLARQPVDPAELASAIRQVQAQIAYTRAGVLGQAEWYGTFAMLDRLEDAEALARRIAKVTAGDLLRVASTYLVASRSTLGWFLPAGKEAEETGAEDGEGRA